MYTFLNGGIYFTTFEKNIFDYNCWKIFGMMAWISLVKELKMHKDKISHLIEKLREELNKLLEKDGFINEGILKKSQELDEMLNKYYRFLMKK